MTSAYAMASLLQPVMFGLFFNALLRFFGIPTSLATAVLGGLLVTALVGWTTYRQVQISARLIGVFLAVEASFVVLLVVVIVIRQGLRGNLGLDPFNPAAATGGAHGIFLAVLFGLLAISGFDVVTPVAEETRAPGGSSRWRPSWSRSCRGSSGCWRPTASWSPSRSTSWSTSSWAPAR